MRFVFLIDLLESLDLKKDSSLILMREAQQRGYELLILYKNKITVETVEKHYLFFHVFPVKLTGKNENPFLRQQEVKTSFKEVDALFIRTDPPFNEEYLQLTWLLDIIHESKPFILNHPQGLRDINEKIITNHFPKLTPPTLITANASDFHLFLEKYKKVVVKPTNSFGGQGIFIVNQNDSNADVIFEAVTGMSGYAIVQKYIHSADQGDKRIILLNGEPLAAILRVHSKTDHRNNFARGGEAQKVDINQRDEEIIKTIQPLLKQKKIYFAGIDILGNYLTEINVTSPTCLSEANKLYDIHLEKKIMDFLEKMI